jgi:hypothetical protein
VDAADWAWTTRRGGPFRSAGCLTFVRGADPRSVAAAFGVESGRELTGAQVLAELREPGGTEGRWIRVGRVGDWTVAVEDTSLTGSLDRLSVGGEAVAVSHTEANVTGAVEYFVDGALVTLFDPMSPWDRGGREPDRFLPALRAAGLDVDRTEELDFDEVDPLLLALAALSAELGIRLPAEVAAGPMLTGRLEAR